MLAYRYIPLSEPIDLLNVAFENPRKLKAKASAKAGTPNTPPTAPRSASIPHDENSVYMTPDRETGIEQLEELQRVCPGRIWNFVSSS